MHRCCAFSASITVSKYMLQKAPSTQERHGGLSLCNSSSLSLSFLWGFWGSFGPKSRLCWPQNCADLKAPRTVHSNLRVHPSLRCDPMHQEIHHTYAFQGNSSADASITVHSNALLHPLLLFTRMQPSHCASQCPMHHRICTNASITAIHPNSPGHPSTFCIHIQCIDLTSASNAMPMHPSLLSVLMRKFIHPCYAPDALTLCMQHIYEGNWGRSAKSTVESVTWLGMILGNNRAFPRITTSKNEHGARVAQVLPLMPRP